MESVWRQLLGDGVRALALAGRWDDAAAHARTHNGIGTRLMEGRQALVIARLLADDYTQAQAALDESDPADPWEKITAGCLAVLCTEPDRRNSDAALDRMLKAFRNDRPKPQYIVFHTRAGLATAALAQPTDPKAAALVLEQVVDRALRTGDGYAAREILRHHQAAPFLHPNARIALNALLEGAGLGAGEIPARLLRVLLDSADTAAEIVQSAVVAAFDE